ncbi:MAG: glycosyltransferase family 9 protein [Rhabdochlamydiaceae bacterium]|nr:glycosyltransferase family 9 protein [Candidatus Amphrikana amoebophyrae]
MSEKPMQLSSNSIGFTSKVGSKFDVMDHAIHIKKVLIVKMSSIGDILHCFPLVDLIKKLNPGVRVDWLVEKRFYSIVSAHPHIDNVMGVDTKGLRASPLSDILSQVKELRKLRYDTIFDLQGNVKSALMTLFIKAQDKVGFSFKCAPEWPNIISTTKRFKVDLSAPIWLQYASIIQQYYHDSSDFILPRIQLNLAQKDIDWLKATNFEVQVNSLMICFGSNWENKQLKKGHLIALLKSLQKEFDPHFIFIFGSEKEQMQAKQLESIFPEQSQVLGNLSIPLWQCVMSKCRGVICMDSAALHLASLARVKTFAFFGPSRSEVYNPPGVEHGVYNGPCPYGEVFTKRCKVLRTCPTGNCLHEMDVDKVYDQIKAWLKGGS